MFLSKTKLKYQMWKEVIALNSKSPGLLREGVY